MKLIKSLTFLSLFIVTFTSLTQCKSSKNSIDKEQIQEVMEQESIEPIKQTVQPEDIQETQVSQGRGKQMPLFIRDAYFKRTSGSGIDIYFPTLINKENYQLKKVYFRGKIGDMQSGKSSQFASLKAASVGLIMSNEDNAEFGNTAPTKPETFPFELKDNECMIQYLDNGKVKYFQVYNIIEK